MKLPLTAQLLLCACAAAQEPSAAAVHSPVILTVAYTSIFGLMTATPVAFM